MLVAVSKGMQALKLLQQFLAGVLAVTGSPV